MHDRLRLRLALPLTEAGKQMQGQGTSHKYNELLLRRQWWWQRQRRSEQGSSSMQRRRRSDAAISL